MSGAERGNTDQSGGGGECWGLGKGAMERGRRWFAGSAATSGRGLVMIVLWWRVGGFAFVVWQYVGMLAGIDGWAMGEGWMGEGATRRNAYNMP